MEPDERRAVDQWAGGQSVVEPPGPSDERSVLDDGYERASQSASSATMVLPTPPIPPPSSGTPSGSGSRGGGWRTVMAAVVLSALVSSGITVGLVSALDDDSPRPAGQPTAQEVENAQSSQAPSESDEPSQAEGLTTTTDVSAVAEEVLPSVARVDVRGPAGEGSGSAVVYREDGYLITNNHVVDQAEEVTVTLPDSSQVKAKVAGQDPASDLAVLQIDATGLTVPDFARSTPRIGQTTVAIGSPFGLDSTVTSGIVSATERVVQAGPNAPLVGMLQTDAAINPGNSGGALVNDRAQLIGINTAILSETRQNSGIGFAIPVSTALDVAEQLLGQGFVEYAQLGVEGRSVTPAIADRLGLEAAEGALIIRVIDGTAAEEAGLAKGDVLIAMDDTRIRTQEDLFAAVRGYRPGDEAVATVIRDGQELEIDVVLGAAPSQR